MNWFKKLLCKLFRIGCPTPPQPPATLPPCRPGMLFGYYGVQDGDIAQYHDNVNCVLIGSWGDWTTPQGRADLTNIMVGYAQEAVAAGITRLIFTLDFCLFTPTNPRQLLPEAVSVQYLTAFFQRLTTEGLMPHVAGWYTIDEPNIPEINLSAASIESANALIRAADPTGRLLFCIYGGTGNYPGVQSFDVVGIDNYGAWIFGNGQYNQLLAQLTPAQRTIYVPGGADPWREDPDAFYMQAQGDPRCLLIMPFKWFGTDGIGVNGMAPKYNAVGALVRAANP